MLCAGRQISLLPFKLLHTQFKPVTKNTSTRFGSVVKKKEIIAPAIIRLSTDVALFFGTQLGCCQFYTQSVGNITALRVPFSMIFRKRRNRQRSVNGN
ncbi:unnamed protein product [Macrosiphum euphorbiae]|uniref:Uncharacterized protein n=1 Tax=Macrosiphum euphorbiae TaxID=13131 RepID=A0AAV0XN34_9HEMI|nr:unnamed protein product [Macrosiphum euphorbiae]